MREQRGLKYSLGGFLNREERREKRVREGGQGTDRRSKLVKGGDGEQDIV